MNSEICPILIFNFYVQLIGVITVFIRVGSTKRVASFDEIQRMIRSHSSNDFELISIDRDDLTFEYIESRFKEKGVKFDVYALLIGKDNKYNNAALLLSD